MMDRTLREFILAHEAEDTAGLMLHRDRWSGIDMELAVRCIRGRQTARYKLPLWYAEPGLTYPKSLPLEQCSSQATALYKQRFVHEGDRVADLTGGLGVDSWSLSQKAASVDYFERSEELCECARHNFPALGRHNIAVHRADISLEMLGGIAPDTYGLVYLDPARRGRYGERVFSIKECEPDITVLKKELLRIAPCILLKASPMADIRALLSELPETAGVHILSHGHECKEVLVLMLRGSSVAVEDIPVTVVEITGEDASQTAEFTFIFREEADAAARLASPSEIRDCLFEPSPALLKSGAFKLPACRFGLRKISASTHFYVGDVPVEHFPGKIRRIVRVLPFNKTIVKEFRRQYPECSVTARNFPMSSEELRKRLGTAESGILRVLGTTASDNSRVLIVSEAID